MADTLDTRFVIDRRTMLAGAGSLVGTLATLGPAIGYGGESVSTDLERENETLVNNFCRDWSKRDAELLTGYMAEDIVYQIAEGQPTIHGTEEFVKMMGPFLKGLGEVRWDILRSYAVGPLVLNERIDYFNAPPDSKQPSMRFQVAGHFLIKDGKIKIWKDYGIPGAEQMVG